MEFETAFEALTGNPPFKWQARLFSDYLSKGEIPSALDLPTGLGKTSVMAVWLIARALGDAEVQKKLPRRLVYVVDRRAVVDQATAEAEKHREALDGAAAALMEKLGLDAGRPLSISTLRGQHVDNRDWLADPAASAIIVGTVDMIGSRLLFEGYGVSRKMRSYYAGLLGADSLIVLDEAHLVPPFEKLIAAIEKGQQADYERDRQRALGARSADDRKFIPPMRLLSLSVTGREREGNVFRLRDKDREDALVKQRLDAKKAISVKTLQDKKKLEDAITDAAWELSGGGESPIRCLIYCDKRETAHNVYIALSEPAKPAKKGEANKAEVELFTGARRFFEREETAAKLKDPLGFIAGEVNKTGKPVFLVATSAAEVGVDLDADHMICDIVAWERMVQRFGRVNRRGEGYANVIVIDPGDQTPKTKEQKPKNPEDWSDAEKRAVRNYRSLAVINHLRKTNGDAFDASPAGLAELTTRASNDDALRAAIDAATTPAPLYPALNRALVDAWSMTSLETHTGRPEVAPWLRGWVDEDGPQAAIVWRRHLPVRVGDDPATKGEIEEFFEAAPPHLSEKLETETFAVVDWLIARAKVILKKEDAAPNATDAAGEAEEVEKDDPETDYAMPERKEKPLKPDDIVAFALTPTRELKKIIRLSDFGADKIKETLQRDLAGATLIINARLRGLSEGLLDPKSDEVVRTADDGDVWLWEEERSNGEAGVPLVKFRVHENAGDDGEDPSSDWHKPFEFVLSFDGEGAAQRSLIIKKWRGASTREEEQSVSRAQALAEHQSWTAQRARVLATGVGLDESMTKTLTLAARLHDEGKRAKRWQRAFNANKADQSLDRPLAKTKGPVDFKLLDGYRHEFGSLPFVETDIEFQKLSDDQKGLVLHLVAAHHGQARPIIETRSCDDAPPSALEVRARDAALRFARLQKQWGPWGLAWLEALLRAADAQASRDNHAQDRADGA